MRKQYQGDRAQYRESLMRYEQDRQNRQRNFMLFADYQRDIARHVRSRQMRLSDRSFGFPAVPDYIFDPDVVQSGRVECPLTPSYAGADDVNDNDDDVQS
ncbi:hypothetical protein Scep_023968 [Stephania cephalantha]|uniref:Uncharacterized protein n=1 Tax=Stephania cephalantha TaxID=152367 RepID=A0AAP0F2S1_9MAGN